MILNRVLVGLIWTHNLSYLYNRQITFKIDEDQDNEK